MNPNILSLLLNKFFDKDPFEKMKQMNSRLGSPTPQKRARTHRGVTKAAHNEKKARIHRLMEAKSRKINRGK